MWEEETAVFQFLRKVGQPTSADSAPLDWREKEKAFLHLSHWELILKSTVGRSESTTWENAKEKQNLPEEVWAEVIAETERSCVFVQVCQVGECIKVNNEGLAYLKTVLTSDQSIKGIIHKPTLSHRSYIWKEPD